MKKKHTTCQNFRKLCTTVQFPSMLISSAFIVLIKKVIKKVQGLLACITKALIVTKFPYHIHYVNVSISVGNTLSVKGKKKKKRKLPLLLLPKKTHKTTPKIRWLLILLKLLPLSSQLRYKKQTLLLGDMLRMLQK